MDERFGGAEMGWVEMEAGRFSGLLGFRLLGLGVPLKEITQSR